MAEVKLAKYKAKRDFTLTQEPHGATEIKSSNRLRFIRGIARLHR